MYYVLKAFFGGEVLKRVIVEPHNRSFFRGGNVRGIRANIPNKLRSQLGRLILSWADFYDVLREVFKKPK